MKRTAVIILVSFISCQKPDVIFMDAQTASKETLSADTAITGVWDGQGKVLRIENYRIKGAGTLKNWIIDAPYTANCFDTSINIVSCKTYNGVFSWAWYGASTLNTDNWWNIQKAINTCLANGIMNCFGVKGVYQYSKPLEILSVYKGAYVGCTLHFYGESSFWDSGTGTTLAYSHYADCALNLQLNKGSEIDHLIITGKWKSPITPDSIYYNTSYDDFKDISGYNCNDWYYGLTIDWRQNGAINGSTGLKIHDIYVTGFTHLIAISQNLITRNAEILLFENIKLGDGKTGFINGQAQEKGNMIKGVYAWGNLHTVFSIGKHATWQAGDYHIDGGNIAGHVIRVFDINASGWYSTSVANLFCESLGSVGTLYSANLPLSVSNCTFHFRFSSQIGKRVLLYTNNYNVVFNYCIFRYYGSTEDLDFNGYSTFNNCFFSGKVV